MDDYGGRYKWYTYRMICFCINVLKPNRWPVTASVFQTLIFRTTFQLEQHSNFQFIFVSIPSLFFPLFFSFVFQNCFFFSFILQTKIKYEKKIEAILNWLRLVIWLVIVAVCLTIYWYCHFTSFIHTIFICHALLLYL